MADDDLEYAIKLQLELIEETRTLQRESENGQDNNEDIVLKAHEAYLKSLENHSQDSRIARSIAQAVHQDAFVIQTLVEVQDPQSLSNHKFTHLASYNGNVAQVPLSSGTSNGKSFCLYGLTYD